MPPTAAATLSPRARWAIVILLPVLAATLGHTLFTPAFQSNDDVGMNLMAAGVILAPHPSPHMLYVNPVLGYPLSKLYTAAPAVPWYYAAHLLTHLVAGMVVAHSVLVVSPTRARAVLLAAFFMTVDLTLYVIPQFTITAALAAAAAVVFGWSRSSDRPWAPPAVCLFVVLVAVGAGWRAQSCLLVLATAAPLVLLRAARDWWAEGLRAVVVRTAVPAAVAALCAATVIGFHKWYDRHSPGWENFEAYNAARGKLMDFQAGSGSAELDTAYRSVGWRPEDKALLNTWGLIDRHLFSAEKIMAVAAGVRLRPAPPASAVDVWNTTRAAPVSRLLIAWSLALLLFLAPTRLAWIGYLSVLATASAIWFVIGMYGHAPPYVFHATQVLVLWTGLALSRPDTGRRGTGSWRLVLAAILLLALDQYVAYRDLRARSKGAVANAREVAELMRAIAPRPDRMYVIWGDGFPYQWIPPWANLTRFRDLKGYPLSCTTNTPHADERLAEFRIDNPAVALYERPDEVLLICRPNQPTLLAQFYVRHHARVAAPEPVPGAGGRAFPDRVGVFRCRDLGPADLYMTEEWVRKCR